MSQDYSRPSSPPSGADHHRLIEALFRIEAMSADVTDIKQAMREMALAVSKLAIFEERQMHDRLDLGRIFGVLETQEARLKALEVAQPTHRQTSDWVNKGVWLVVGGALTAVLSIVLVSPSTSRQPPQPVTAAPSIGPENKR